MLQLILGKAGFGKSSLIRNKAIELTKQGKNVIVLVPDQMSFETEKNMLYTAGEELYAKMKVYQFHSLCEDVFTKYGGISEKRIDDTAKTLIVSMAIKNCEDKLELYKTDKKSELISLMISAIDEFKSSQISTEDLMGIKNFQSKTLNKKIKEISLIYENYEAILENTYLDPKDTEKRTADILQSSDYFKNTTLLIDGFEGFDKTKLDILQVALRDCYEIYASFCTENYLSEEENSIFTPINQAVKNLVQIAKLESRKIAKTIKLETPHRFKSDDLIHLEENLYRQNLSEEITPENINFYEAFDVSSEIEYVCANIKELVRQGKKYGDINVVCRNSKKYMYLLEEAFKKWEIPAFISKATTVDKSPLIRIVMSCFNIINYGFSTSEIMVIAKSRLCGLSIYDVCELENYIYLWKIDGVNLKNTFTKSPFGFTDKEFSKELEQLESLRKKLILPIEKFINSCKNANAFEISTAIYQLLIDFNVEKNLIEYCKELERLQENQQAEEQERIWEILMEILDKFALVIGEKEITAKEYGQLLKLILSKEELMKIPQLLDTVTFGTADNLKKENDIVFLVGLVQDEFPQTPSQNGVFTVHEMKTLAENDIELQNDFKREILLERYFAYSSACSCKEKLFVSYHLFENKSEFSPSEFINRFKEIFKFEIQKNMDLDMLCAVPEMLFSNYAKIISENSSQSKTLRKIIDENEDFTGRINALERILGEKEFSLDEEISKEIFAKKTFSPSQIELFHQCKFWYFCRYGLSAKERKVAQVDVLEYGTLMHYVFEKIFSDEKYKELDDTQIQNLVNDLIENYVKDKMGGSENLSVSDKYRFVRMKETATILVLRLAKELKQSEFVPEFTELKFGDDGDFPCLKISSEYGEIKLGGIADRVDTCEKNGEKFARVIDYKTGNKEFKYYDVLNGISLQMLIYLSILKEHNLKPAGAFYMHSSYPSVSAKQKDDVEKTKKKIQELMRLDGILIDDTNLAHAMEDKAQGEFIPVKLKTQTRKVDGEKEVFEVFDNEEYVLSNSDFETIFKFVEYKIKHMLKQLLEGDISAIPNLEGKDYCEYCPFKSVCNKEREEATKPKICKEQAIKIMKGVVDDEEMD